MNKDDFFIKSQIENDFRRVTDLINTGIFSLSVLRGFQEAVFIEIMIKLHDLLQKLSLLHERVSFVCHIDSGEHILKDSQQIKFTFNIAYGKVNVMTVGKKKLTSDYQDDICFFFGDNKIYLKRHIVRCIQESRKKIQELYGGGDR